MTDDLLKALTNDELIAEEHALGVAISKSREMIENWRLNQHELRTEAMRRRYGLVRGDLVEQTSSTGEVYKHATTGTIRGAFVGYAGVGHWSVADTLREGFKVSVMVHKLKHDGTPEKRTIAFWNWRKVDNPILTNPERDGDERLRTTS